MFYQENLNPVVFWSYTVSSTEVDRVSSWWNKTIAVQTCWNHIFLLEIKCSNMASANQTPEQKARDRIDNLLTQAGWIIQPKSKINLNAGLGVAVREYQTDAGLADYVLFVERQPIGIIEAKREEEGQTESARKALIREAAVIFTGELVEYVDNVGKVHEQIIDTVNIDRLTFTGWDEQALAQAQALIQNFTQFIEANKDEITALQIFYNQTNQQRGVTYQMIQQVLDILKIQKPYLAPL